MSSYDMNYKLQNRPLLMKVIPLWLRTKIFYKIYLKRTNLFLGLFEDAILEFTPQISLKLMPTDISHKQIAFCGFYELTVSQRIAKLAQKGGLMVDVGANYGYYSCLWAAAKTDNRVISFEASPRNSSALKNNLIKNKLLNNVEVHEIAVGKERGRLFFNLGPEEQSVWGGLLAHEESDAIEVSVISLDEMFLNSKNQYIDVLKVDTEGADTWVLQGAEQLLRSHRISHIFFEENIQRMEQLSIEPGKAQELLKDCGYKIKTLTPNEYYACL